MRPQGPDRAGWSLSAIDGRLRHTAATPDKQAKSEQSQRGQDDCARLRNGGRLGGVGGDDNLPVVDTGRERVAGGDGEDAVGTDEAQLERASCGGEVGVLTGVVKIGRDQTKVGRGEVGITEVLPVRITEAGDVGKRSRPGRFDGRLRL